MGLFRRIRNVWFFGGRRLQNQWNSGEGSIFRCNYGAAMSSNIQDSRPIGEHIITSYYTTSRCYKLNAFQRWQVSPSKTGKIPPYLRLRPKTNKWILLLNSRDTKVGSLRKNSWIESRQKRTKIQKMEKNAPNLVPGKYSNITSRGCWDFSSELAIFMNLLEVNSTPVGFFWGGWLIL